MKRLKNWLVDAPSYITVVSLLGSIFAVAVANAQVGSPIPTSNITTAAAVGTLLCTFVNYMFWFVIIISIIMVLYASYTYVTASDDTEKTSKARRILVYSSIGIIVALLALGFPSIVATITGNNTALKACSGS